jgi:hypothetical protein
MRFAKLSCLLKRQKDCKDDIADCLKAYLDSL